MVALIEENAKTGTYNEVFDRRYKRISEELNVLKEKKKENQRRKKLEENLNQRVHDMDEFLQGNIQQLPEFDDDLVRRLIESIKILSQEKLLIQFKSGIVMEKELK